MKLSFTLREFKRAVGIATAELGPLERQVMELVWRRPERAAEVSVRDIHLAFDGRLAYTTLMTTLDRLHKKGLLDRRKEGRAFFYSAHFSPDEFERGVARDVINSLLERGSDGVEPILACIIDAVSERERALLRFCPDIPPIASSLAWPGERALDRAWAESSEAAADEHAATGGKAALDLASALVKIARLVPDGIKPAMPAGALFIGDDPGAIAPRVSRLTQLAMLDCAAQGQRRFDTRAWPSVCLAAILISAIMLATIPSTLLAVHELIEIAVSKLQ